MSGLRTNASGDEAWMCHQTFRAREYQWGVDSSPLFVYGYIGTASTCNYNAITSLCVICHQLRMWRIANFRIMCSIHSQHRVTLRISTNRNRTAEKKWAGPDCKWPKSTRHVTQGKMRRKSGFPAAARSPNSCGRLHVILHRWIKLGTASILAILLWIIVNLPSYQPDNVIPEKMRVKILLLRWTLSNEDLLSVLLSPWVFHASPHASSLLLGAGTGAIQACGSGKKGTPSCLASNCWMLNHLHIHMQYNVMYCIVMYCIVL